MPHDANNPAPSQGYELWQGLIADRLERMRFGSIQISVHDGRIVQIDFTERTRLSAANRGDGERP